MEFEGKVALVTGAGRGIGQAIAIAFAREGADVAINDLNLENAKVTASKVRDLGRRSIAVRADVSVMDEVTLMIDRIINELGGVDILVNNAGFGNPLMVEDMMESDWHRVIGVIMDGAFYCSRAVIEPMRNRGGGKIVNISSLAGKKMSIGGCAAYTAAKSGILGFTRHLAFEIGPYKINVNAICPGATLTPAIEGSPVHLKTIDSNPLKDICRPEDIANTALFLASDKARMITGISIDVDGGESLVSQDWEGYVKRRKDFLKDRRKS